uniref:Uncharacterized protein n=1 Tax=Panagrolaimus sp. PS1159 TaxID=55785 RepID=A0AC35ET21_9BILA
MAFMYPHHIPQLPSYEELFEPTTISRCTTLAAQKDDSDKPSVFMPDPSWAPRAYSRSYDPAGLRLTLPPHRPANAELEDEQRDGSPLLDPNPVASDDEEDMASEGGSHNDVDDMDVDNANSEEDIEDM